jgi:hypothetical protein
MFTAKPLIPESSPLRVEIAIQKLKGYKEPGIDQIVAATDSSWR